MSIVTDFTFGHQIDAAALRSVALRLPVAPLPDVRGDLVHFLAGAPDHRDWAGTGFNLIWRPDFEHHDGNPNDFFLELDETIEKLSFKDISGNIPGKGIVNRGALQKDIQLGAFAYTQEVFDANRTEGVGDKTKNVGLHFEPGVWINVEATTSPHELPSIARMGSIPHGTTVNLQGQSLGTAVNAAGFNMAAIIKPASITPSHINPKDSRDESSLQPFPAQENIDPTAKDDPSRTKISSLKHVDNKHLKNPNAFLLDALAGLKITKLTTLIVGSDRRDRPSGAPDIGGGNASIAFLQGNPTPNADAVPAQAIFWLEEGVDGAGKAVTLLQYSQRVLLKFNGLNWPHVSVGTLRPV